MQVSVKRYQAKDIIEEEAKKSRSSRIMWAQITKNKKYTELIHENNLYANHEEHLKKLKQAFRKAVKEIETTLVDKNGQTVPKYYYDQQKDEFIRRNEFEDIKNQESLLKFIEKNPKGIMISDQLLEYTYKDVQKDIEKLLNTKRIKRILSSNKTKSYYIFANTIEQQYGLGDNYEHFGKDEYLEFCKKNYKVFEDEGGNENAGMGIGAGQYNSTRFNEWVPGYAQMKEEWLVRNREKIVQQNRTKG